ncbi:MAG: beta-lactamase class A [Saprospiraceae bacterium]|jgi:beta-lactamase class A
MRIFLVVLLFSLFSISITTLFSSNSNLNPSDADDPNSNVPVAGKSFEPLRSQVDESFQASLEQQLNTDKKLKKLIAQKKISIGLVDLMDSENVRFAQINGDEMMYAASLPKIAVLLTAMDALENGELKETPEVQKDMFLMINKSNNQASTRMIDRLGFEKIEEVLTDPKYALYDKEYGGGLWVGKRYAGKGKKYPDPLQGLSHAASATQVSRFYYMMLNGMLVNEDRSKQMMSIMSDPGLHHKFVNTLDRIAPDAKLYRKSGSWSNFHSDSVMVLGPERRYILVALAEDAEGEKTMRNLVKSVEEVLNING